MYVVHTNRSVNAFLFNICGETPYLPYVSSICTFTLTLYKTLNCLYNYSSRS